MKTMTCNDLGGACDKEFHASSWEDMVQVSKNHGTKMVMAADPAHLEAMRKMSDLMSDTEAMKKWFEEKEKQFDSLSED